VRELDGKKETEARDKETSRTRKTATERRNWVVEKPWERNLGKKKKSGFDFTFPWDRRGLGN